jgi:CRISPR/Cas system-associated exonuclease Cas4 (RecB family)
MSEKLIETWENQVDSTIAVEVLRKFKQVEDGWLPPLPKTWKCKSCEFKGKCRFV